MPKTAGLYRGGLLGVGLGSGLLLIASRVLDILDLGGQVQVAGSLSSIFNRELTVLDVSVNLCRGLKNKEFLDEDVSFHFSFGLAMCTGNRSFDSA